MQNHLKPSITEKRRNKAKYPVWNSIKLKFVKKTSMLKPVKSLGYIKCHSLSTPRPVKIPTNSIRNNCEKISSWSRRPTCLNFTLKSEGLSVWYKRKRWFLWTMAAAQAAENHEDKWSLIWYFIWRINKSIPTWTHSQNSLVAAGKIS